MEEQFGNGHETQDPVPLEAEQSERFQMDDDPHINGWPASEGLPTVIEEMNRDVVRNYRWCGWFEMEDGSEWLINADGEVVTAKNLSLGDDGVEAGDEADNADDADASSEA